MSHFTVMVKVDATRLAKHDGNVQDAVAEMLAPYQENNMGDCPEEFLVFNDKTDEVEERAKEVVTADSYFGKKHPEHVGKTLLECYDDIAQFVKEYFGYKRDEETGKYGYWENPNSKWDWYQIGGRWTGMLRVKEMATSARKGEPSLLASLDGERDPVAEDPHTADIATIEEIDFEGMDLEVDGKIEEFWESWQKLNNGDVKDAWDRFEIMSLLERLGLSKLVSKPVFDEENNVKEPAKYETQPFTLEDLKQKYRAHWEFGTWAVLDNDGWHEKGSMGWWGMHDATPEDEQNWDKSYVNRFLRNESPDTLIAIVDCHI